MADKNIVDPKTGRFIAGGPQDTNKNGTAGRPSLYTPDLCETIVEFFRKEPTKKIVSEVTTDRNGIKKEKTIEVAILFPTMIDFAESLNVGVSTLKDWKKQFPDFSAAYMRAKQLQENIWVKNSLNGSYNPQFSIFLGKNVFGYKDKQETDLTTKGKSLNVAVVSYEDAKK